jgi:phosphatidylethanolamine/phosphatidyl-N-methylethanolamine N-methyltransferase
MGEIAMAGQREFLRGLFESPRSVCAPTPSSASLSAAIANEVDPDRAGLIVELGPGTGVVTEALLNRGISPARLLIVERTPAFVALLQERFPAVAVIQGDGLVFDQYLPERARIAAVVSGLPLLSLSACLRQALVEKSLAMQGRGGRFVQLSYGWRPAVPPSDKIQVSRRMVWHNLPPAFVWTYAAN